MYLISHLDITGIYTTFIIIPDVWVCFETLKTAGDNEVEMSQSVCVCRLYTTVHVHGVLSMATLFAVNSEPVHLCGSLSFATSVLSNNF